MPKSKIAPVTAATRVRKNMDMDARKLSAAQALLGARSETETVDLALDLVVFQEDVVKALEHLAALGGLDDPYAPVDRAARRRVAER